MESSQAWADRRVLHPPIGKSIERMVAHEQSAHLSCGMIWSRELCESAIWHRDIVQCWPSLEVRKGDRMVRRQLAPMELLANVLYMTGGCGQRWRDLGGLSPLLAGGVGLAATRDVATEPLNC